MKTTAIFSLLVLLTLAATTSPAANWYVKPDSSGDRINIQTAIALADSGDTIILAADTVAFTGPGNSNIDFMGRKVTVMSESGPESTTIDCGYTSRGFVFQNNEDSLSVLMGVTIINGRANFYGGAVYCRSASPKIVGNQFGREKSGQIQSNQSGFQGGAVYCDDSNAMVFENDFSYNGAPEGGALWISGGSEPMVRGNRFFGNVGLNMGGALACDDSSPFIYKNHFSRNSAPYGGAIEIFAEAVPVVRRNVIEKNTASIDGGGMRCRGLSPSAVIDSNTFWRNTAGCGGAIHLEDNSLGRIANNTIVECHAPLGAGIFCWDFSDPDIEFNIIANCSSGAAVEIGYFSSPFVGCCDFYGNEGGDRVPDGASDGKTNMSVNPLFCDPDQPDLTLASLSPCLPPNRCGGQIGAHGQGCDVPVGIEDPVIRTPRVVRLKNCPNPFNPSTRIDFDVVAKGPVTLTVYDVMGRRVTTLVDEVRDAGAYSERWDGRNHEGSVVATGIYFCVLRSNGHKAVHKMVLLK